MVAVFNAPTTTSDSLHKNYSFLGPLAVGDSFKVSYNVVEPLPFCHDDEDEKVSMDNDMQNRVVEKENSTTTEQDEAIMKERRGHTSIRRYFSIFPGSGNTKHKKRFVIVGSSSCLDPGVFRKVGGGLMVLLTVMGDLLPLWF
jgi:hypothetical protein